MGRTNRTGKGRTGGTGPAAKAGVAGGAKRERGARQPDAEDVAEEERPHNGLVSLALKDFQRHAKIKVAFAPDVTTVVGASDRGKSSLLRALGCVAIGEPDGAELIRHDAPGFAVQLKVGRHTIVRKRGKTGNVFVLDGVMYTRDRGDWPPAKVLDAVRLCPQNFQWQLDGPLWFLDSAGTVAKQLNKVVDLEAIDAVIGAANSVTKEAVATNEGAVQEYEAAKHAYRSLKWVPEMLAAWGRLQERLTALDKTTENKRRLEELHRKLDYANQVKTPEELFAAFAQVKAKKDEVESTAAKTADLRAAIKRAEALSVRVRAAETLAPAWGALADFRASAEAISAKAGELSSVLDQLWDLQREEERCLNELKDAEAELSQVEKCPACKQPLGLTGSPSSAPTYTSATNRRPPA